MKRHLYLPILTVICLWLQPLSPVQAQTDDSRFHDANSAYSQGEYQRAIAIYEELIDRNGYSPGVLYNLAGSYAQAGQVGRAILNYERAARLAPGDPDVLGNLRLVRETAGLFASEPRLTDRLAGLLSLHHWLLVGAVGVAGLAGLLTTALWLRIGPRTFIPTLALALLIIAAATLATIRQQRQWQCWVVLTQVPLLISPFDGAAAAGSIQEGRLVFIGKNHGNFLFIQEDTGRSGWVAREAVEPIVPSLSRES